MRIRAGVLLLWAVFQLVGEVRGQEARGARQLKTRYLRAVATHFRISFREVEVLSAWGLPEEETPVVLYMATRGGVSADIVVSLRRDGSGWVELGRRLGVAVGDLYVPLDAPGGSLSSAYARFRQRPRSEWAGVRLSDREVVALVNLRVLSSELGVPPERVLHAFDELGDFVAVFESLSTTGRP